MGISMEPKEDENMSTEEIIAYVDTNWNNFLWWVKHVKRCNHPGSNKSTVKLFLEYMEADRD